MSAARSFATRCGSGDTGIEVQNFITGTVNADGSFPNDRTYLWYPSGKISWQIAAKHNFSAYFNMAQKKRFKRNLSAQRPPETTVNQQGHPIARLFTFRDDRTVNPKLLVSIKTNVMDHGFELRALPGMDVQNTPARFDQATGIWADAPPTEFGIGKDLRSVSATASYLVDSWLGGQHDFRFGADISRFRAFGDQGTGIAQTTYPADHRVIPFNLFNGAPLEVWLFQSGAQRVNTPTRSAFAQDSWKLRRLTLNAGVRWDWQANSLAAVTAPKSRFFNDVVSQPDTGNLITWNTVAPRLGVIYDLSGNAKTLLKGSYSRYYWQLWTDKASQASVARRPHIQVPLDRPERRPQVHDRRAGRTPVVDDPARNPVTIDSNLNPTKTDQVTVGLSRELLNVPVTASYTYSHVQGLYQMHNPRKLRRTQGISIFSEGWGLDNEHLMQETGFFANERIHLRQLQLRLWRNARVIYDVGMHTGKLTYDEAVAIMTDKVGFLKWAAELEIGRAGGSTRLPDRLLHGGCRRS